MIVEGLSELGISYPGGKCLRFYLPFLLCQAGEGKIRSASR